MGYQAHIGQFLDKLAEATDDSLTILRDAGSQDFKQRMSRWSDIDRKTPAAIVLARSESHVQETVRLAVESGVSFVVKSGGHSTWSTIGPGGFILDLSEYWHLEVDSGKEAAIIRGSVLSKQLSVALAEKGLFTAIGAGNSIGAVGYFLGGGTSPFNSLIGNGSDQIVAARLVDTMGNVVAVNEEKELDLLYAIRGAGQYFGVVTELTIRGHPISRLGNPDGTLWVGRFIFPLERVEEIAVQMQYIANDGRYATSGMVLLMAPPPDRKACVLVSARYFGDPRNVKTAFQRLYDLKPSTTSGGSLPPQNMNDAHKASEVHGSYTRYGVVGLQEFEPKRFTEVARLWQRLVSECPDANNTSFNFQWDSRMSAKPFDSANSLHDTRLWQNNLLWYDHVDSQEAVDEHNDRANSVMRGSDRSKFVEFPNGTREALLEYCFRPQSKLEKLKALKQKWDPTGVFTTVLLD